jgi:Uma2 family endonuclease
MVLAHAEAAVPPLEAGDLLTREEFYRRWELHPEIKKAERIGGRVFLQMTVHRKHGKPHARVAAWLGAYEARREDLEALLETTVRLGDEDFQPDALVRYLDGASTVGDDDCIEGPPELVVEVSASSVSYDLNLKKELYRRSGVAEYLVWQVYEGVIDWWKLETGAYVPIEPDSAGILQSAQFPGLRLAREALLAGDMAAVLAALD